MATEPIRKEQITVYLPSRLKATIKANADEAGQTLSVWIERACITHLADMTKEAR